MNEVEKFLIEINYGDSNTTVNLIETFAKAPIEILYKVFKSISPDILESMSETINKILELRKYQKREWQKDFGDSDKSDKKEKIL